MPSLAIDEAERLVSGRLEASGVPPADARAVAQHLVHAERRGYASHGLRRLRSLIEAARSPGVAQSRTRAVDLPGFVLVDAKGSLGIPSVVEMLQIAAERAREAGAIVAGVRNYVGTTGCLGVYGASLADAGFASIMMCHSDYAVAPHGSRRAILGTNPISVAIPSVDSAFVADVATAAWSYGALREAMAAKQTIPRGIVQSVDGAPSTDPNDADNGSQLPMAGHKGYALGLAVELLCGPLLGGKAGRDAVKGSDAFLAVVIAADAARVLSDVHRDMTALFTEITQAPLAPGFTSVRIPGSQAASRENATTSLTVSNDILSILHPG